MRIILGKKADYKEEGTRTEWISGVNVIKYSGPVARYPRNPYRLWSYLSGLKFAKGVISDYASHNTFTSKIVKQKSNSFVWKFKDSARSLRVKVLGSNFVYDNELKTLAEYDSGRYDQTSIVTSGKVTGLDYSEERNSLYEEMNSDYMSKVSFRDLKEYEMVDGILFPGDKEGWEFWGGDRYKAPSDLGYTVFEEEDHILEISDYIWREFDLGSGDDIIISPKKADEIYGVEGRGGADIFKLKRKGKGYMSIDFNPEDGDKIDVHGKAEKYKVTSASDIWNEHGVDAHIYFGVDNGIFVGAMDFSHFILHKKNDVFAIMEGSEAQIIVPEEKKEFIDAIMSALI